MRSLAKVELQLVLQFLDTQSRFRAARCSRALLAAAAEPFAWQHGVVRARVGDSSLDALIARIHAAPFRDAPIALHLDSDCALSAGVLASLPRLHRLRLDFLPPAADLLAQLVHPALRDLRALHLPPYPDGVKAAHVALIGRLPQLRALSSLYCPGDDAALEPLRPLESLTALDLCNGGAGKEGQRATVGRMTQLRSLRLGQLELDRWELLQLCSAPALGQLRRLTLHHLIAWRVPVDEWRGALIQLRQLESLRLQCVWPLSPLLESLAHAPALRSLIFDCAPDCSAIVRAHGDSSLPDRAALRTLLAAAPLLAVRLRLPPTLDDWLQTKGWLGEDRRPPAVHAPMWEQLRRLAKKLRPRVTLIDIGAEGAEDDEDELEDEPWW